MRIARKFVALLLLGALAAAITGAVALAIDARTQPIRRELEDSRVEVASSFAGQVADWTSKTTKQVEGLAALISPWNGPGDPLELRARLDRGLAATDSLGAGAYIVNPQGRVVGASSAAAGTIGLSREGAHITAAFEGSTSMSSIVIEPLTRASVVGVATPLRDRSGKVVAVLTGLSAVKDGPLGNLAKSFDAGAGTTTYVIDPGGVVLDERTASGDPHPSGLDATEGAHLATERGTAGFLRHTGEGSVERIAAYAPAAGWSIVVTEPVSSFYATTTPPVLLAGAAAGAISILFISTSAFFFSRWRLARRRAEASQRAFLALAGHELRTPLTVIRGFGQTLLSKWDKMGEDQRKEMLGTIALQSRNLEHLVERLIVASQLEAGAAGAPSVRATDLVPILSKAAQHHQSLSVIHDVKLESPEAVWAEVDSKFLQQAIDHLLENAIKFSPSGGEIRVIASPNGKKVTISVEDEGVGLPADSSRLFEKFSQSERVETRIHEEGGVGVGLYIVKSLVERMGGSVEARRRKPAGTKFVIRVPAADRPADPH